MFNQTTVITPEGVNIKLNNVRMKAPKEPISIDCKLLQTDLWFTAFGKTLKQMWNPHERILVEGELYKYKPGIDTMYITRWCQLTKTSLRIYKNQMAAKGFMTKPIIALPLNIFKGVK